MRWCLAILLLPLCVAALVLVAVIDVVWLGCRKLQIGRAHV